MPQKGVPDSLPGPHPHLICAKVPNKPPSTTLRTQFAKTLLGQYLLIFTRSSADLTTGRGVHLGSRHTTLLGLYLLIFTRSSADLTLSRGVHRGSRHTTRAGTHHQLSPIAVSRGVHLGSKHTPRAGLCHQRTHATSTHLYCGEA
eukprot:1143245-Pelagomonas_calceolata.AAC.6